MSGASISIDETAIKTGLRALLLYVLPEGVEVVTGQNNRVGEPVGVNFITVTTMNQRRLSTNTESWDETEGDPPPTTIQITASWQWDMQLDIHGPDSATLAATIGMVWRSAWAAAYMIANQFVIAPLYADEPHQMPFINAEGAFENRWTVPVYLQVNPVVSLPQQFFDALELILYEADT